MKKLKNGRYFVNIDCKETIEITPKESLMCSFTLPDIYLYLKLNIKQKG